MKSRRLFLLTFALSLLAVACGGGGDDDAAGGSTQPTMPVDDSAPTTDDRASEEVPSFLDDFSRVCTTQVGFGGVEAFTPGGGVNQVVLFESDDDGSFFRSGHALPAGWAVTEDTDFEDSSELKATRLVACADRVQATPNGTSCEFESDGQPVTLELVDTVYELTIHAAKTGEPVGEVVTLEAASTECPFSAFIAEGETQYENEPTEDDLINALRPFVGG